MQLSNGSLLSKIKRLDLTIYICEDCGCYVCSAVFLPESREMQKPNLMGILDTWRTSLIFLRVVPLEHPFDYNHLLSSLLE